MLIDAHAHVDSYDEMLEAALAEIRERRILTISTAMDLPSYTRASEIGDRCEFVLPAFGVHPWKAPAHVNCLEELRETLEHSPMLGEIGLDYHNVKDASQYPAQRTVFEFFLQAAGEQDKIVNLHTTGAEEEVLNLIARYSVRRGIVHWYSGPLETLQEMIAYGLYFTIGVEVLHTEYIRTIAQTVPSAQLLTETDNPGGAQGYTGAPGMPRAIEDVVSALAELQRVTPDAVERTVQANFARLIRDDARFTGIQRRFFDGTHLGT